MVGGYTIIDLNLYTIAITRLNNGFQNIGQIIQKNAKELKNNNPEAIEILIKEIENTTPSFKNSSKNFEKIYLDIVDSLNQKKVNNNEYEAFLNYIIQIFPQYQESLIKSIDNLKNIGINNSKLDLAIMNLDNEISKIINTFTNLLKIAIEYLYISTKNIQKLWNYFFKLKLRMIIYNKNKNSNI